MAGVPQADPHDHGAALHAAAARLETLLERALLRSVAGPDETRQVLDQFATGIEELRIAGEELVVQAEQPAASQQAIDAERKRYAQLFEDAPDAYIETDALGKIHDANAAAEAVLGVRRIVLVGKLLQTFIHSDDRRAVRRLLNSLEDGSVREYVQARVTPRNGAMVTVEMSASAHLDPVFQLDRVRWLLRDIGERLKIEQDLRRAHGAVELLDAMANLTGLVAAAHDGLGELLAGLVDLAEHLAHGCHAGIMLTGPRGHVVRHAVSSPVAQHLCDLQIEQGGPGLDALRTGESQVHDGEALAAWPAFREATAQLGIGVVLSQPLRGNDQIMGVVNVYAPASMTGLDASVALLATHGGSLIASAERHARTALLAEQLTTALESRGVIEQAKGILMAREACTADHAFDIIRRASQRENRKLRLVAEDIVARAVEKPPRRGGAVPTR